MIWDPDAADGAWRNLGQEHFRRAIALVESLPLDGLRALLAHHVGRFAYYRNDIAVKLARSREQHAQPEPALS